MIKTYMQSNLAFAGGIQELSLEEIDVVGGGADKLPNSSQAERDFADRLSALNDGEKYKCMEFDFGDTNPATDEQTPGKMMVCARVKR